MRKHPKSEYQNEAVVFDNPAEAEIALKLIRALPPRRSIIGPHHDIIPELEKRVGKRRDNKQQP